MQNSKFKIWPRGAAKFRSLDFVASGLNRRVVSCRVGRRRVGRRVLLFLLFFMCFYYVVRLLVFVEFLFLVRVTLVLIP